MGTLLTQDDWELVYVQTTWANQKVRLVLADTEEDGCEILAEELNGMSSQVLLLITPNLEYWTSRIPLDLCHTDFQLEEHGHLDLNLVWFSGCTPTICSVFRFYILRISNYLNNFTFEG